MKKQIIMVVTALLVCLTATTTNAQSAFKKSDKIVEGTASYSSTAGVSSHSIKPSVGYFVTDKVAVGVYGELGETAANKTSAVGAYGRFYILDIGKNLTTYTQLNVSNSTVDVAGTKTSTFATTVGVGANYFITPRLALTGDIANIIGYSSVGSVNTFSIGWNGVNNLLNQPSFGLLYRF